MKKILCGILSIMFAISFTACQSASTPEETVKGYFEAAKASDAGKMNSFVNPKNVSSETLSSTASKCDEADLEKELNDYLKGNNKKVEYTIKSTDTKDSSATVTVDCKFVDAAPILKDSIADFIPKAFAKALTNSAGSDDSAREITNLMKDKIKTTKETYVNKTIKVNCVKIDGKWYINKANDDLLNVFSSNLVSTGKQISKLFGGTDSSENASSTSKSANLPDGNYKETGKGKLSISTPSGTSENGNAPILYANKNEMDSIGISARNFDGSKLSYVYVDKKLNTKDQYSDTDTSIYLSGNALSAGKHEIEVVQYDTNKPDGKIATYKSASYEIKSK